MAEHTPGPWIVVGSGFMVSTCADHERCQAIDATRSGYNRDEDVANTHLIAAAPELLTALEAIVDQAVSSFCEYCGKHAPKDEVGNLIGEIKHEDICPFPEAIAAIVKARGQSESGG